MICRYKPFFVKSDPGQLDLDDSEIVPQGQLEMMCIEISRLATTADILYVFCTFAIGKVFGQSYYRRIIIKKIGILLASY